MITKENYLNHISYRETLEKRAYEVANLLNKLQASMWEMFSDSGELYFYDTSVSLQTAEYFRGSYDSTSMNFKSDYLFMSDEEIIEDAKILIEQANETARQIKEASDKLAKIKVEEKERIEFERLKKKYDN
jgi:hypothetical protein